MIVSPFLLPSGATAAFHKVNEIRSVHPFAHTTVETFSYASEDVYLAGSNHMWASRTTIPQLLIEGSLLDSVEHWLVSRSDSPFAGGSIVTDVWDSLDGLRARKAIEISQRCEAEILAGFTSSALGAPYRYPGNMKDQINLSGSVLRSVMPNLAADWATPFWCADNEQAWAYRMHSAAQIQQVGRDAIDCNLAYRAINERLQAQILVADAVELNQIRWPT